MGVPSCLIGAFQRNTGKPVWETRMEFLDQTWLRGLFEKENSLPPSLLRKTSQPTRGWFSFSKQCIMHFNKRQIIYGFIFSKGIAKWEWQYSLSFLAAEKNFLMLTEGRAVVADCPFTGSFLGCPLQPGLVKLEPGDRNDIWVSHMDLGSRALSLISAVCQDAFQIN